MRLWAGTHRGRAGVDWGNGEASGAGAGAGAGETLAIDHED